MAVQPTAEELLRSGVDPSAIATLQTDRPIFEARQEQDALDKIAPIISQEEVEQNELDKLAPKISTEEAEQAQLDAIAPVVDPLDIFSDDALIADKEFSPKVHYITKGGAAAFDATQAARLGKIRKGQEASRSIVGTAAAQLGNIIPAVPKVLLGVGRGIASGAQTLIEPLFQAGAALVGADSGFRSEHSKLVEQQAAEALSGAVAETAGLVKGVGSLGKFIGRKTGIVKDWSEMTDEEAFRAIINEGEAEREIGAMAQGDIPALAPTREALAAEGVPVRPEAVQEATAHGMVGWLGFGAGINVGSQLVKAAARGAVRGALPAIAAGERVVAAEAGLTAARTAEEAAAKTLGETTTATTATGGAEALVQQAANARTLWESAQSAVKTAEESLAAAAETAQTTRGAGILAAADKAAQLAALRTAKDIALRAFQSGPKNAEREAALQSAQDAFKAAEEAIGESNLAKAIDSATRARNAVSTFGEATVKNILGRPVQAAGATAEFVGKAAQRVPRGLSYLGAIGGLFVSPQAAIAGIVGRELVAPLVQRAGTAVKNYGKSVATGEARRTLDLLGAVKDTAAGGLRQYPMDLGFSIGLSDTEQEAREAPPIATALGVLPGAGRGIRRVVTGELITPKGSFTPKASPAYGENKVLDTAHATAMKTVDETTSAQLNWMRELARKMGGRVYLMPDTATFETTLTEIWKQQNPGREVTPDVTALLKQAADQQGFAWGEFTAADGEVQPTVFIKNPETAVHEIGHVLEKVLPGSVNARLDEQILARLSPENLEAAGTYYANRLSGTKDPNINWREVVQRANPNLTPEQYLAREMRAENMAVLLKNRGEAFASSPGLYRWLAQTVAKIGDAQGIPLAQSEALGFPVFGDVMAKGEKAARKVLEDEAGQELVQARGARLRATPTEAVKWAKTPATPETGQAEAAQVISWLETAKLPISTREAAARTLAAAISDQQGVRLTYFGAKGEPGGDPAALRPERRAEIEAQRDAANANRPLVTKDYFPYGAIITSKGPQFKGWSPNNFNANVARFAEWIAAHPEAAKNLPLAHDLTTEAGQRGLQADLQTFVQNQQAGYTGSGLELVVPAGTGATQPVKTGVKPVTLPQERADAISYLFNLKLPETPRVTAGKIPLNIVGQRVSEATLPGRLIEPIRPRGEFTGPKAEALGIAGERVQEVNPFRQAVEQAAKDAGTKPPELIEAAQILALERIADATVAPELPAFGGNVTTLTAGFLPSERPSIAEAGMEILRMSPDEFIENSSKWPGGFSSEAKKIGLSAKSPEDVKLLRDFQKNVMEKAATAMKAKDYSAAMALSNESALFREAIEVATGVGGGADWMRKNVGESYTPPVAETSVTTQALPKKTKNEFKLLPAGAAGVSKAWVLPGGKVEQLGGQWHHDWLDQNKDVQKKYGLEVPPFEGGDAEAVRESALKKGFARVNYSRNTGTLTVEARAKDWRKQKGAIERLVEENLDDIDNMTVHLLDESVQKVVDSDSVRLFNFEDVEKMANLPFITKGEVRGQFLPKEEASENIRGLARSYAESAGIDYAPRTTFPAVNESLAKKLADFYDAAESKPEDPAVQKSYQALADETMAQYRAIEDAGYSIEPWTGKGEPYKNSAEAVKDVRENKHLYFLKTEGNFRSEQSNPLLVASGIVINEQPLLVNDVFRAVHDFFGHAKEGYQFGPRGEFNAWNAHSEMFSPEAQGALAAETLAQNSWVNYGPHLRNETGAIPKKGEPGYRSLTERPFAEQKNVLVPPELIAEAKAQFSPKKDKEFKTSGLRGEEFEKARAVLEDLMQKRDAALDRYEQSPPGEEMRRRGEEVTRLGYQVDKARTTLEQTATRTEKFGTPVKYDEPPEINSKTIQIPKDYDKHSTSSPSWVLPDGRAFYVSNGTFYHDSFAKGLADVNKFGELDAIEFQARAGAMRIATPNSARSLIDAGNGELAVSVSLKPTEAQLKILREYLEDVAESGDSAYSNVAVEVLDAAGSPIASKQFDNFGKITAGQISRFLKNPPLTETTSGTAGQFLPAEQTGLPGISTGREFDRKAIEGMSQAQLKEYFPEAIIPKKNTEFIPDNIVGSPLAKAAGSKEAAVQAFADKLVRDYRAREDDPMVKAGEKWYSEFTPLLKKEFGKDSRIFAELLAATSPNNQPSTNFAFALDALRNWKSGKYDKMISKFNEGLNKLADGGLEKIYQRDLKAGKVANPPEKPSDATYLAYWIEKNNLIPLGSSGKRFSMHSVPVLKVLARKWMTLNTGPKTDNFIKNLVGEGDEATVDLWAARSLRRLGYEGFQDRWRILPRNKTGVSDEDFVFSQQVFRKAADELGIKPSALQGAMWYAEKKLWSENGWGRLDLGDYKTELERMPLLRSGFQSREATAKAEARAPEATQNELDILPR